MGKENKVTHELLLSRFDYDRETGCLIWKERPLSEFKTKASWASWNAKYPGRVAGTETEGRVEVTLKIGEGDPVRYKAHRLIWFYVYGDWPEEGKVVDHIDGDSTNNRLENLRVVDHTTNNRNKRLQRNNTSGRVGVSWDARSQRWVAQGVKRGRPFYLGQSPCWEVACQIRERWEQGEGNYTDRNGSST